VVFATNWRLIISVAIGMIFGVYVNGIIMAKLKVNFNGRYLWMRSMASTLCAEIVFTYTAITLEFIGYVNFNEILKMQVAMIAFKVLWEIFATPFLYIASGMLKRVEGVDKFDYYVNFNPFSLDV
jgi:queuosine precursor transporter